MVLATSSVVGPDGGRLFSHFKAVEEHSLVDVDWCVERLPVTVVHSV